MVNNKFDNFTRLSAYGMVGIGEGEDFFFDALHSVLESDPIAAAVEWSEMSADELMRTGYWLCSLALEATLPDDEVLVDEVGSEKALACAATVAWAIAKRLNGAQHLATTFHHWLRHSPLTFAMSQLVDKCEELKLNSIMPQSHNTTAERLGSVRRSHMQRAQQRDPLPNTAQPLPNMPEHLVVNVTNNFYENSCHFGAGSTLNGDVNLKQQA